MSQEAFNPRDEFTRSVATLRGMLERCENFSGHDPEILKTALQIIKEINRLFRLYTEEFNRQDAVSPEVEELGQIREYLKPLGLGDDKTPTLELVRLVTYTVMELRYDRADVPVPKEKARRGSAKPKKVTGRSRHLPNPTGRKLEKKA